MDLWIFGLGRKYCNIGELSSRGGINILYVTLWTGTGEYLGTWEKIATQDRMNHHYIFDIVNMWHCENGEENIWKYCNVRHRGGWMSWNLISNNQRMIVQIYSVIYMTRLLATYILDLIKSLSAELHLDLVEPVNLADIVLAINWLQKAPRHLLWKSDVIQLLAKI